MISAAFVLVSCLALAGAACKKAPDADKAPPAPAPAPAPTPAATTSEVVNLRVPQPQVGDKHIEASELTMQVTMTDDKGVKHDVTLTKRSSKTEEILGVSGGRMTKVKISYPVAEMSQTFDGAVAPRRVPHAGNSYIVDIAPDKLTITTPDGKPPADVEIDSVIDDQVSLLHQYVIERILASKTFRRGEPVVMTAGDLEQWNTTMGDEKVVSATFTLRTADASTATFDTAMVVEDPSMKAVLTGTAVYDRNTFDSLGTTSEGTVSGSMTGTMRMRSSYKP